MIQSFADKQTEMIFNQQRAPKLPPEIQDRALVKLLLIHAAEIENDLARPLSNHFEHLRGARQGYCSIRINDQWRICFRFTNGHAYQVTIEDYH